MECGTLTATLRKGETAELARRERVMPYMTGGFSKMGCVEDAE
jgi:hypothetical protein